MTQHLGNVDVIFEVHGFDKNKNLRQIEITPKLDLFPKFSKEDYDRSVGLYFANQFFPVTDGLIDEFAKKNGFKNTEDMLKKVGEKFIKKMNKKYMNTIVLSTITLEELGL